MSAADKERSMGWAAAGIAAGGLISALGVLLWRKSRTDHETVEPLRISASVGVSAPNRPQDVAAVRRRLRSLGFDWIAGDGQVDTGLTKTLRLVNSILRGRHVVRGPSRVDPEDRWLNLNRNAPHWIRMPAGGAGFTNYEQTDLLDDHDFGTMWLAETIRAAGQEYARLAPEAAALITINDASRPQGGPSPDHAGHECGLACDLRLPRTDGMAGGISIGDPEYDQSAATAQIEALAAQPLIRRILFNDEILIKRGLCRWARGHDNHIHIEIAPPVGALS